MSKKITRNSNHELLRIIAMFMIVFIHANMYLYSFVSGRTAIFFNGMVNGICNIGVTCFILISGYYGIKFDVQKLVRMECMMITYSLAETVLLCLAMPKQLQGAAFLEQLVKSCLPFITRKYWFYSCYVCLFFFSGYIQKFIEYLKQEELERLLILLLILFSVLPTFFYFELVPDNGKGLLHMIMVYMIGRYIRMYRDVKLPGKAWVLFIILWVINGISHEMPIEIGGIYHHLCKDNSITNLTMAVILFYLFKNLDLKSRFINEAASNIFAVFALNNTLVAMTMTLLFASGFQSKGGSMGFAILTGIVTMVLLICLLIGIFRKLIFNKMDCWLGKLVVNTISKS